MNAIFLVIVAIFIQFGGPVQAYYSFVDHEGSRAYERRSYSEMGHHWIRVCDRNPFYTERGVAGKKGGGTVKVYDTLDRGCGYKQVDARLVWHKTCSVNQCGGTSNHRRR